MKIKWHGTASVTVKTENTTIVVDPYLHRLNPELPPVNAEEIKKSDAIFITHPHTDHFADISSFMGEGTPVYVSQNGINHARKAGISTDSMRPVRAGEKYTVGDITVHVYQSRHCKFDLPLILSIVFSPRTYKLAGNAFRLLADIRRFRIKEDIYFFLIEGEGRTLALLGSAGLDKRTVYPVNADLLVFPYQGRSDMAKYSLPLLLRLRPARVLLDHYDDAFPPFTKTVKSDDIDDIKNLAAREMPGVPVSPFVVGEWYDV